MYTGSIIGDPRVLVWPFDDDATRNETSPTDDDDIVNVGVDPANDMFAYRLPFSGIGTDGAESVYLDAPKKTTHPFRFPFWSSYQYVVGVAPSSITGHP